jgi:hypothetical protein
MKSFSMQSLRIIINHDSFFEIDQRQIKKIFENQVFIKEEKEKISEIVLQKQGDHVLKVLAM